MGRKRRMKKLSRKQRMKAKGERNAAQVDPQGDSMEAFQAARSSSSGKIARSSGRRKRYYCPNCDAYHDVGPESNDAETAEIEAAHAAWRKQYSWEELVRRHGEEGAAIIADCL